MKIIINKLLILALLISVSIFSACEKSNIDDPVGLNVVYIPQSASSGGVDLNYAVPSSLSAGPRLNYIIDNNKVNVILGVSVSGKNVSEPYSVDVTSRADTINQLIGSGSTFVLLPSTAYSLPQNVSVTSGNTSESFYLSIDKSILKTYAGKKVAVCVVISNLSNAAYTLSTKNRQVIVIIDVDALKLT